MNVGGRKGVVAAVSAEIIPMLRRGVDRGPGGSAQHCQDHRPVFRQEGSPEVQQGQFVEVFHELTALFQRLAARQQKFGGNMIKVSQPGQNIAAGQVVSIFHGRQIGAADPAGLCDVANT